MNPHDPVPGIVHNAEVSPGVFQSRWGFYSVSYETYLKIKRLHKRYWKAVRMFAEWKRWARKQAQNRVHRQILRDESGRRIGAKVIGPRPAPPLCPVFTHTYLRIESKSRCVHEIQGPLTTKLFPPTFRQLGTGAQKYRIDSLLIREAMLYCMPRQRAEDVQPMNVRLEWIDQMIKLLDEVEVKPPA